ncbi:polyketide synthase [Micromonospora sp. NPDC002296]|uniref:polyketide synthase n=1 Tax=Micromonospora sp. NPDC002296 TaxID=3154271 RepID=UPI0033328C48
MTNVDLSGRDPVLLEVEPPVAVVRLQDVTGRNRISGPLGDGLRAALGRAAAHPEVRAVVLEGLPDVFCAGGSADRMLGGHQQRVVEVWRFLRAVLDCPLPVVAAAQGHALGGGFLLALYCDVAVLSASSRYAANFLTFGFTPTGGATWLLPTVLGRPLGTEMLYTSRSYRGQELADRGAGVRVVAHDRVAAEARATALRIAAAPRACLEEVKAQLAEPVRHAAEAALHRETPAHEATVGTGEAAWRIRMLHGERLRDRPTQADPVRPGSGS